MDERTLRISLVLCAIASALNATSARAECGIPEPARSLQQASLVFGGTVVSIDGAPDPNFQIVTFMVNDVWKGTPSAEIKLSAIKVAHGVHFQPGVKYLVFAHSPSKYYGTRIAPQAPRDLFTASLCESNTFQRAEQLGYIRAFGPPRKWPSR